MQVKSLHISHHQQKDECADAWHLLNDSGGFWDTKLEELEKEKRIFQDALEQMVSQDTKWGDKSRDVATFRRRLHQSEEGHFIALGGFLRA